MQNFILLLARKRKRAHGGVTRDKGRSRKPSEKESQAYDTVREKNYKAHTGRNQENLLANQSKRRVYSLDVGVSTSVRSDIEHSNIRCIYAGKLGRGIASNILIIQNKVKNKGCLLYEIIVQQG
jgi:hypothetical protein